MRETSKKEINHTPDGCGLDEWDNARRNKKKSDFRYFLTIELIGFAGESHMWYKRKSECKCSFTIFAQEMGSIEMQLTERRETVEGAGLRGT